MKRALAALSLLALTSAAGCGDVRPCAEGTVLVQVDLSGNAADATSLAFTMTLSGGAVKSGRWPRPSKRWRRASGMCAAR